jgi:hypothetical protein
MEALVFRNVRYCSSSTTSGRSYEPYRPKTFYTLVTLFVRPWGLDIYLANARLLEDFIHCGVNHHEAFNI